MGLLRIPKKCEEGKDGKILLNFAKSVRRRCEEGAKEMRREGAKEVRRGCEGRSVGERGWEMTIPSLQLPLHLPSQS